jgi:hypothetical protein
MSPCPGLQGLQNEKGGGEPPGNGKKKSGESDVSGRFHPVIEGYITLSPVHKGWGGRGGEGEGKPEERKRGRRKWKKEGGKERKGTTGEER